MLIEYEVNLTVPLANGKYCCLNLGHSFGIMFQQLNIDFENKTNFDFVSTKTGEVTNVFKIILQASHGFFVCRSSQKWIRTVLDAAK